MKSAVSPTRIAIFLLALLSMYFIWGMSAVPFHPDESTYLFMSADFAELFTQPANLGYDPAKADELKQHYRLIDAPLTRYLLGFARTLAGIPPLQSDWDWGKTWEQNDRTGALPDPRLLLTARLAITLLLPLSLLFTYTAGSSIDGPLSGLLAALFLAASALVLLHARRAMAEGALIFGVAFFLWSLSRADKRPWLTGLALALAFNAKHSTFALFPLGLLAAIWMRDNAGRPFRRIFVNLAQYLGVFLLVTFMLNPVYWKDPARSIKAALDERQDLMQRQVADARRSAPGGVLDAPGERIVAILANLYITPPQFYEVGNYINETRATESRYRSIPGHNLLRGFIGGGILLLLTILGMVSTAIKLREKEPDQRRAIVLLMLGTILQLAGLLVAVPLPWQRYSIPLVPFVALWMGFGLSWIVSPIPAMLPKLQKHTSP